MGHSGILENQYGFPFHFDLCVHDFPIVHGLEQSIPLVRTLGYQDYSHGNGGKNRKHGETTNHGPPAGAPIS